MQWQQALVALLAAPGAASFLLGVAPGEPMRRLLSGGRPATYHALEQRAWVGVWRGDGLSRVKCAASVAADSTVRKGKRRSRAAVEESTPVVDGAKLLIVESATKARTIQKFLPQGWEVDFCMGHVRELPRSLSDMPPAAREKTEVVGVRVKQAFEPMWVVLPSREPVVNRLKEKAAACSELYLATDEDREGEAISWHLVELLKPTVPVKRVVFHEITPSAVQGGLDQPREIDQSLVEAQHARRVLDRVAGYTMSPLLWRKIGMGLSAGRVQSVGLKLLIDRERERMLFRSAQFAALKAALRAEGWDKDLEARLQALNGKRVAIGTDFDPRTGQLAEKRAGEVVWVTAEDMPGVAQQLESRDTRFRVVGVDTKVVSRRRPAPFTTSTLQQDANSRLGLTSAQTMKLAQELYEEGYISYMRTDNPNMGPEAQKVARDQASELYSAGDVQEAKESKRNAASASAQEAHEAIRPSIVEGRFRQPKHLFFEDKKKADLYQLIYERTLASVMKDAKIERKSVSVHAVTPDGTEADLVLSGQTVLAPGFLRALRDTSEAEGGEDAAAMVSAKVLSDLKPGQALECSGATVMPRATSPPYRFTQGSFVRMIEELGVGRPSTYSTIIEVLKQRRYFTMKEKQMVPTLVGFVVTQLLERHFPDFVDASFTSRMESALDSIAKGEVDRTSYLTEYYSGLTSAIDVVTDTIDRKSAKRVVLPNVADAPCAIFVGPFGPYARDLLPGEPTDADLIADPEAARGYYQELWADDDLYLKSVNALRRTPVPKDMQDDPSLITKEALLGLLDMTAEGMRIGTHPDTGAKIVLRVSGKYGRSLEMVPVDGGEPRRVQVPQSVSPSSCSVELALRLLQDFPRPLGPHPTTGEEMVLNLGYFPSIRMGSLSYLMAQHSLQELVDMTPSQAAAVVDAGKGTYFVGEHKDASIWFVPRGRYTYPHLRYSQAKIYLNDQQLGADGRPTLETAIAAIESRKKKGRAGSNKQEVPKSSRTASAFQLFSKEARATLEAGLSFGDKQKALAAKWKELAEGSEERQRFVKAAEELKVAALAAGAEAGGEGKAKGGKAKRGKAKGAKAAGAAAAPKGPRSAYMLFAAEKRPELPKGMGAAEQAKALGAMWKALSDGERGVYEARLKEMKETLAAATA